MNKKIDIENIPYVIDDTSEDEDHQKKSKFVQQIIIMDKVHIY
jgi:hypothetical protein